MNNTINYEHIINSNSENKIKKNLNEKENIHLNSTQKETSKITKINLNNPEKTELPKKKFKASEKPQNNQQFPLNNRSIIALSRTESPVTMIHDHLDHESENINNLTEHLFEKINIDQKLIHLAEFSNKLLEHNNFTESNLFLLEVLLKILPDSTIEERKIFLQSLQKKVVLGDDFSILDNSLLDNFTNEEFNFLKNHLEIELADTKALFKLIYQIIEESSPELANFLLGTLDLNAHTLLKKNIPINLFRSSALKNIADMIKEAKSLNIDLSKIPELRLLSSKRNCWTILTPQINEESGNTKNKTSLLITLGRIGQGSINKVNLVWDQTRSTFFAMRTADVASFEKITKAIKTTEEVRDRCLFNDAIVKPGELITLEKTSDLGVKSYYASLEELAVHKDLAQQFSLFRIDPRELMIQLIQQFIQLQKSNVALVDIKPANINVYEISGKHFVKFSDLDGAKTLHSIKKDLNEAWEHFTKFYGNNPDKLKEALKNLNPHGNHSLMLDFDEECNAYRLFRKALIEIADTYISPAYSTGSREYAQKILFENTEYIFEKLSEMDTTKESFDEGFSEIAYQLVDRFQKLDCHSIGCSLLEVLIDLSTEEKQLRYKILKDVFFKESILKQLKIKESVTPIKPVIPSESLPDPIKTKNPFGRNYLKATPISFLNDSNDDFKMQTNSGITEVSPEEILIRLKEKIEEYMVNLPDNAKLPPETSDIILDLITGNLSNNEVGLARLAAFIEAIKQSYSSGQMKSYSSTTPL